MNLNVLRHAFRWHAYHNTAGLVYPNAHGSSFFQHTGKMTSGQQDRMKADGPVLQYLPCIWIRKWGLPGIWFIFKRGFFPLAPLVFWLDMWYCTFRLITYSCFELVYFFSWARGQNDHFSHVSSSEGAFFKAAPRWCHFLSFQSVVGLKWNFTVCREMYACVRYKQLNFSSSSHTHKVPGAGLWLCKRIANGC